MNERSGLRGIAILLVVLIVSLTARGAERASLDGTAWRLVKITSMDDKTFAPDDPEKYTLTFKPGGALAVQADCNSGHGKWVREGPSGLRLGPLTMTQMACPPGSLAGRFVGNLDYVRSFVQKNGHIFLATMADGAILEFEPLNAATGPSSDCDNAEGEVEKLVCDDAELSALRLPRATSWIR